MPDDISPEMAVTTKWNDSSLAWLLLLPDGPFEETVLTC
jgi:hypothetical protein